VSPVERATISAVIVHYRGGEHVGGCVGACLAVEAVREVVIVDNEGAGARLRSAFPDPRVRVIAMRYNVGFGRASNVGLALATEPAVLLLNQDAIPAPDAPALMLAAGDRAGAWLVGPRLLNAVGIEQSAKAAFSPPLRWTPSPPATGEGWELRPWISGAAMLFMPGHTDLRFDERFFMYVEDEELCWRVWTGGGRVAASLDAVVAHVGGTASSERWSEREIRWRMEANRARMILTHAGLGGVGRFAGARIRYVVERNSSRLGPQAR
jgi:N-acetylglucosaminyl-diphospho-decaprenol L-rhamnosyltransferase